MTVVMALTPGCGCEQGVPPRGNPGAETEGKADATSGQKRPPTGEDEATVDRIKEFALSEAKRLLEPAMVAPSAAKFHTPAEPRFLDEGTEALGRLYLVAGELDAPNTFNAPIRYRWSAVVGARGKVLSLVQCELTQRGEESRTVYLDPTYEAHLDRRERERVAQAEADARQMPTNRRMLSYQVRGRDRPTVGWRDRAAAENIAGLSRKSSREDAAANDVAGGKGVSLDPQPVTLLVDGGEVALVEITDAGERQEYWVLKEHLHPYEADGKRPPGP